MGQEETKINEEEEKPIVEEVSWDKPDFIFIPKGNHLWHQEGFYLVCDSCDLRHATYIGKDKMLVGFDDDHQPILKRRKELGMV
jgi:hypothetical protein